MVVCWVSIGGEGFGVAILRLERGYQDEVPCYRAASDLASITWCNVYEA